VDLIPKNLTRSAARLGAAAQNALEIARFGGLDTHQQPSPYELICERRISKLRRYYPGEAQTDAPPVLLIPPMMLAAEVYDVSPQTSAVTTLKDHRHAAGG
jgi:putative long chain acyl-CoA synthase